MKLTHRAPIPLAAGTGAAVCMLRLVLYRTGFDDKGILSASHPLNLLSLALVFVFGCFLLVWSRRNRKPLRGWPAAAVPAGLLLLLHALSLEPGAGLALVRKGCAFLCAGAMVLHSLPSATGRLRKLCSGCVCAVLCLEMLCRYRSWSGNPQLPDYTLHTLACVFLCLATYHHLALAAELAHPRIHRFCCLMALCLCVAVLSGPEPIAFYLGGGLWSLAVLCMPQCPAEEEIPAPPETDQEESL